MERDAGASGYNDRRDGVPTAVPHSGVCTNGWDGWWECSTLTRVGFLCVANTHQDLVIKPQNRADVSSRPGGKELRRGDRTVLKRGVQGLLESNSPQSTGLALSHAAFIHGVLTCLPFVCVCAYVQILIPP